jgi:hypothetical protein
MDVVCGQDMGRVWFSLSIVFLSCVYVKIARLTNYNKIVDVYGHVGTCYLCP